MLFIRQEKKSEHESYQGNRKAAATPTPAAKETM